MSHAYLANLEKGYLPPIFIPTSRSEQNFRVILGAIAVITFIGGLLALCCGSGGTGAFADACMKGGYVCFATGIGSILLTAILEHYYSTRKYGNVRLDGPLMQPQNNINRFYNSLESLPWFQVFVHVLHQTVENLYNLKDGGWGGDYSTDKQLPQLYGPSQPDPDSKYRLEITHGGHATTLFRYLSADGSTTHLLTDANLAEGVPPQIAGRYLYTRGTDPGFTVEWLKTFVGTTFFNVFYSHDHGDHRDDATAQALVTDDGKRPNFHCPKGLSSYFGSLTPPIETARDHTWWEEFEIDGGVKVTCVPSHHSTQTALTNCQLRLWCGWIFQFPTSMQDDYFTVYFPGDIAGNINPETKGFLPEYYAYDSTMFYQIKSRVGRIDLMFYGLDPIKGDQTNNHSNLRQGMDIIRWLNPVYVFPYHHGVWPFNDLPAENNGKLLIPLARFEERFEETFPANADGPKMYPIKAGERVALLSKAGNRCFMAAEPATAKDEGEKED